MAPPGPARIARVLARVDAALAPIGPALRPLAEAALAPAREAAYLPGWPPIVLPLVLGEALGLAEDTADRLAAACVLFFASADVIDDAQDGDLPAAPWPGWPSAVSIGMALVFSSQREAIAAAPARAGELAAAFADAGLAMSLGQAADVAERGGPGAFSGERAYLACVRGKTGGSIALFATLPALAAGAAPAMVAALGAWGVATGAALQLASDLADAAAPASRDRATGRATLPVARAWANLAPAERPLLEAAWRGEADAPDLAFLLARTGTTTYIEARVAALRIEARDALAAGGVPPALAGGLDAWSTSMTAGARAPL